MPHAWLGGGRNTSDEVLRSLDAARKRAERLISLYRIGLLLFLEVVGAYPLLFLGEPPYSELFGLGYLTYAIAIAWAVRRFDCTLWLSTAAHALDLGIATLFFMVLAPHFSAEYPQWAYCPASVGAGWSDRESSGMSMMNVVPRSGRLSMVTLPPCASAAPRTWASPSPQPRLPPESACGSRWNSRNSMSCCSAGMAPPWLCTITNAR